VSEDIGSAAAWETLRGIPLFGKRDLNRATLTPLGRGQHNKVFKVTLSGEAYALRLGKRVKGDPEFYVREAHNLSIAARSGIGAPVAYFETGEGVLLTRFLDGISMTKEEFADLGSVHRAGEALRGLHSCSEFSSRFDIFERIRKREKRLAKARFSLPTEVADMAKRSLPLREALAATTGDLAPCHNDGIPANYIDMSTEMRLIDWQCAGQGDPHWELAALCVQSGFSPTQEQALLRAYFEGKIDPFIRARLTLHKAVCAYYWVVWHYDRIVRRKGEPEVNLRRAESWAVKARTLLRSPDIRASREVLTK